MRPFKPFDRAICGLSVVSLRPISFLAYLLLALTAVVGQASAAPFAYVAIGGSGGNKVAVLDVATNTVVREITVGSGPYGVAALPAGRFVYVTNVNSHNISVIDTQTNVVTSTITPMSIDGRPESAAVNPAGTRLYVTNRLGQSLSVIELASGLPIAQIPLFAPKAIAINPAGTFAYVAQSGLNGNAPTPITVAVVDLQQNRVVAEIPATVFTNILFSPDGSRAYFVDLFNEVAVVNTATHSIIARLPPRSETALGQISSLALSADGSRLYAVTPNEKRLNTIDTATGSVLSRFAYGDEPTSLIVNSSQQTAIVFGSRTSLSTSVNLNTGEITKSYDLGGAPSIFGAAVTNGGQAQSESSSGGGGGCGYISGTGGPPDPTLPTLAALALLTLLMRRRAHQRNR